MPPVEAGKPLAAGPAAAVMPTQFAELKKLSNWNVSICIQPKVGLLGGAVPRV